MMPHLRHIIDLSIPLAGSDTDALQNRIPPALRQKPTPAQLAAISNMTWWEIFREMVKRIRNLSEKPSPEDPGPVGRMHVCNHAEGKPCTDEQEI